MTSVNLTTSFRAFALGVVTSSALAMSASANVVDFSDPWHYTEEAGPYEFGPASLTVTADSFTYYSSDPFMIELDHRDGTAVTVNQEGLGVDKDGSLLNCIVDCNPNVDGYWGQDILIFEFDQEISLTEINFDNVSGNDQFVFFAVDTLAELMGPIAATFFDITDLAGDEGIYSFNPSVSGTIFGIGALHTDHEFRVEGLKGTTGVVVTPLPPTLPLFLGALLGLGILVRHRNGPATAASLRRHNS